MKVIFGQAYTVGPESFVRDLNLIMSKGVHGY